MQSSFAAVIGLVMSLEPLIIREESGVDIHVEPNGSPPELQVGERVAVSCRIEPAPNNGHHAYLLRFHHVCR